MNKVKNETEREVREDRENRNIPRLENDCKTVDLELQHHIQD